MTRYGAFWFFSLIGAFKKRCCYFYLRMTIDIVGLLARLASQQICNNESFLSMNGICSSEIRSSLTSVLCKPQLTNQVLVGLCIGIDCTDFEKGWTWGWLALCSAMIRVFGGPDWPKFSAHDSNLVRPRLARRNNHYTSFLHIISSLFPILFRNIQPTSSFSNTYPQGIESRRLSQTNHTYSD